MQYSELKKQLKKRMLPMLTLTAMTVSLIPMVSDGARAYCLTDGEQTDEVMLFREDEQHALKQSLFDEEEYFIQKVELDGEDRYAVTVKPRYDVTVHVDGREHTVYTGDATVEEIVQKAGVLLDADDETEPARGETITGETEISVIRVTTEQEVKTKSISYETVEKKSKKLYRGETKVKREGKDGTLEKTYELVYRNGELSERNLIQKKVTKEPVDEIVLVGTKQPKVKTASGSVAYSRMLTVEATAYSGGGLTASGTSARVGAIAVDPSVIPLGSRLYITSADGSSWVYGYATAEDTGGAIKGNRIDLYFSSEGECQSFGRQSAIVYVLE